MHCGIDYIGLFYIFTVVVYKESLFGNYLDRPRAVNSKYKSKPMFVLCLLFCFQQTKVVLEV